MKKIICVMMLIVTVGMLAACGNRPCGLCNEKKSGKKYTVVNPNLVQKVEIEVCEDCYADMNG